MNLMPRCRLIFLIALLSGINIISAQTPHPDYRELIIQVPGIASTRGFPEIRGAMINIPGVHVVAFCQSQHLVMLKIENKKLPDNRAVFEAISHLEFRFNLKEGATIKEALKTCRDEKITEYKYDDLPTQ